MLKKTSKPVNLALQGGGSHGSFTWGVLNRLLDDNRLDIKAISGVSSGAMNACVLGFGLIDNGREGAKESIAAFWNAVSEKYKELFEFNSNTLWKKAVGLESPKSVNTYLSLTEHFSPYQLNPFDLNPLKDILRKHIDFELLRKKCPISLYIGTTDVGTGKMRVFTNEELTVDVLLASACLPSIHHAIEIDGKHYWDGGYSGNPPLFPLIFNTKHTDILIVLLQPLIQDFLPTTAKQIRRRIQDLSFSNTFLREMQGIALSKEQIKKDWLHFGKFEKKMNRLNIHIIEDKNVENTDSASRCYAPSSLINDLYLRGLKTAGNWLTENYDVITKRSSVDLIKLFT